MTNILTPTYPERRGENEADRYEAEAAQTILGPVPLSVAIATTLKQLREECPIRRPPRLPCPAPRARPRWGFPRSWLSAKNAF